MTITTLLLFLVPLLVLVIGGWIAWQYFGAARGLFGGAQAARIGLSEVATLDGKRRLMLIYRDGVEHLVMTGGPIDVVIEQGIQPNVQRRPSTTTASFEPRLASQAQAAAASAQEEPGPQAGINRLRQRSAPAGAEPYPRPEPGGKSSGGSNR